MNITIFFPYWLINLLFYSVYFLVIALTFGLIVWLAWKVVYLWLKGKNLVWAFRAYISLKHDGMSINHQAFDTFMPTLIADWCQGNAARYAKVKWALEKVKDGIRKEDLENEIIP